MKLKKAHLIIAALCMLILFPDLKTNPGKLSNETLLVGCTPGDPLIKSVLNIFYRTNVDFIRWNLILKNNEPGINTFLLTINYGEAKVKTQEFKNGGEKLILEGVYSVSMISDGYLKRTVYQLKCYDSKINIISFVKINDNLFHLLTPGNQLMVGNSGWSYTLSRKIPVDSKTLPSLTVPAVLLKDTARQITFEGRTPCSEFARVKNFISARCSKIKWRLTLNRDPKSLLPTTYKLLRISDKQTEVEGSWTIIRGSPSNSDAIIYKLDPDKPDESISLFVADRNVIFFLDKSSQLIIGNDDFSYTLNKKYKVSADPPEEGLSMNKI